MEVYEGLCRCRKVYVDVDWCRGCREVCVGVCRFM